MNSLYGLLPEDLDELMLAMDQPRYRADQILRALYRKSPASLGGLSAIPAALRRNLESRGYAVSTADEVRRTVSQDGDTTKLLLRMVDGTLIETVLMQYPGAGGGHPRSTVCVSTQAGCAMGCVFCATGQMGFERNLHAEEIVAQVVHFARLLRTRGQHVTNVVFMGMGEPLANYNETLRAVRILTHPRAFGLGQRHVTISTVGIVRAIDRLASEGLQVGLAISLHAAAEPLRQQLVPTAGPTSAADLVTAARRYFAATGRRVTFEYALIAGVNDSPAAASELGALLRGMNTHVNLIPVNPTAGEFARPARARVIAFETALRAAGVNCTVRAEKGVEISAACGQLRTDTDTDAGGEGGTSTATPAEQGHVRRRSAPSRWPSQSR